MADLKRYLGKQRKSKAIDTLVKISAKTKAKNPKSAWIEVSKFCYKITEPTTGALFVFVGNRESSDEERNSVLNHVLVWAKDSIRKDGINNLIQPPKY